MKYSNYLKFWHLPKKYIAIIVIVLIGLGWYFYSQSTKKSPIEYVKVERKDLRSTISASGSLSGKNTVSLRFKAGGKLGALNVKSGDIVQKGDVIASLDTQELNIELRQAQNTLKDKQAAVDKVIDDIHLFQYGNGGSSNVGTANETQAQKQLRVNAEITRDNALDNVKSAQRAYQDAVITSPLSGIVTKADPIPGQIVTAADIIAQVSDNSEVVFEADADEADIGKIELSQPVDISLDSYPDQTFKGTVAEILPVTKVNSSGATVVPVKISLGMSAIKFIVGLNGQAEIITKEVKNVLTIPQDSLKDDNTVVVRNGNKFEDVKITTGLKSDTDVEVLSGLQDGQEIVKNPQSIKK